MKNTSIFLCLIALGTACHKSSKDRVDIPANSPTESTNGNSLQPGVPAAVPEGEPKSHEENSPEQAPIPASPGKTSDGGPMFVLNEEQYWVYKSDGSKLLFNTPWDSEEGDDIETDKSKAPDYARDCAILAKDDFQRMMQNASKKVAELLQAGATSQAILLVNVVEKVSDRNALRMLDRDTYFWNWPDPKVRPYFALANFRKGVFVWEVIAAADGCIGPETADVERYLDYALSRLTSSKGVKAS